MADILLSGLCDIRLGDVTRDALQGDMGSIPFPFVLGKNGGIGFQLEGGLITVTATNPQVQVTFDRPMTYNGDYTPNPTGPFDIGQPVLTPSALALDIPVTVPPAVMALTSVTHTNPYTLELVWEDGQSILSTVGWYITPGPESSGADVTITGFSMVGATMTITTTEHTQGASYVLHIPAYAVVSSTGKINASGTSNYVGIGQTPVAYLARALTSSTIKVVFSEPMDTASATDPNNYAVSGLTIYGVAAESPTEYVVSTSTMVPNTDYVLEVTGVIDRANNPV